MRACPQCASPCEESHRFCPGCGFPVAQVAPQSDDPLIGKTLPGGYVIIELVGIGGMGRVYRAEQTALGRTVAVKIIHPHLVGEENAAARFITEARAASRLNHPNSVGIIDFGKTQDGQHYLVMEYIRGRDLSRVAYEDGPLPFRRIVDVLRQTLSALSEAHSLEIIHRDLKPENIILSAIRTGGDFVKVVDFGLAKMRVENGPGITSPGIVCGTPEYMSPEQGRGDPLDHRSDVYAMGVIFYQLLTGRLPFEAESPTQVVLLHLTREPDDPRTVAPERDIPESIVNVLKKSMSKSTEQRYQSADEFSAALRDVIQELDEARTRPSQVILECVRCHYPNPATQKFCGECGSPLSGMSLTPTANAAVASIPRAPRMPGTGEAASSVIPARRASSRERLAFPLPLVGRDEEIAWLEEQRERAASGFVALRLVGDAGLGKTRLAREFIQLSQSGGDPIAIAGPDPVGAEVSCYALRTIIERLAHMDRAATAAAIMSGSLTRSIERGLADIFDLDPELSATMEPDLRKRNVVEALRWVLTQASVKAYGRPVLVFVDDLQNVDGVSRNAIADLVMNPPKVPLLFLAAHSPEHLPSWRDASQVRVLAGLSNAVVGQLFARGGISASVPPATSRGTAPLYVDQVLRFTGEEGTGAPARLGDLIALRVERLGGDARRVLQAISVVGDQATADSLRPLLGDFDFSDALNQLRAAGMVEGGEVFGTTHPLLREIALGTIPAAVRRELHQHAAEGSELRGDPIEVRALHEFHAQRSFEALFVLERLANLQAGRGDSDGVVLTLRRGLELARRELFRGEIEDPLRAVFIFSRKLGEALAQTGAFVDAEGVLRESLDLAGPGGPDRARVLGALANVARGRKHMHDARMYLREALELAKKSNSNDLIDSLKTFERSLPAAS